MFYHCNGSPRRDFRVNVEAKIHERAFLQRAMFDARPIDPAVHVSTIHGRHPRVISLLDWFHPLYVMFPRRRWLKWKSQESDLPVETYINSKKW